MPHHAEIALAAVVSALVLAVDLRGAIGFSSFGVLIYYAIANASAWTQTGEDRRWPRWLNALGLVGCLVLVATLAIIVLRTCWHWGPPAALATMGPFVLIACAFLAANSLKIANGGWMPLADKADDRAPYFSIVLVAGWSKRPTVTASGVAP